VCLIRRMVHSARLIRRMVQSVSNRVLVTIYIEPPLYPSPRISGNLETLTSGS